MKTIIIMKISLIIGTCTVNIIFSKTYYYILSYSNLYNSNFTAITKVLNSAGVICRHTIEVTLGMHYIGN